MTDNYKAVKNLLMSGERTVAMFHDDAEAAAFAEAMNHYPNNSETVDAIAALAFNRGHLLRRLVEQNELGVTDLALWREAKYLMAHDTKKVS